MRKFRLIIGTFVMAGAAFVLGGCDGKRHEDFFTSRQVTVGANTYNYRVFVPKSRQPGEKLPLMLYLHGSGARGEGNEAQVKGFNDYINENPERFTFIIVAPQCRPQTIWTGEMIEQAVAALDQSVAEFNGDDSRIYLAGYSMGGYAAWNLAILYPGKFAALVPVSGGIKPDSDLARELRGEDVPEVSPKISALIGSADPYKAFAEELKQKPIWVFQGARDDAIPSEESQKIVEALKNAGNSNVNYTEFETMGHNIIGAVFNELELFEWLGKQKLNK